MYIKREWTGSFEKGIIEFDDIAIWSALSQGLERYIEIEKDMIKIYKEEGKLNEVENAELKLKKLQEYLNLLEPKNELILDTYSIKKKKVDYHFNEDLRKLSDEEILNIIRRLFPEEHFHILPIGYRSTKGNKFMVPGRKKDYLFTYDKDLV